jgi:hypothetical protein
MRYLVPQNEQKTSKNKMTQMVLIEEEGSGRLEGWFPFLME